MIILHAQLEKTLPGQEMIKISLWNNSHRCKLCLPLPECTVSPHLGKESVYVEMTIELELRFPTLASIQNRIKKARTHKAYFIVSLLNHCLDACRSVTRPCPRTWLHWYSTINLEDQRFDDDCQRLVWGLCGCSEREGGNSFTNLETVSLKTDRQTARQTESTINDLRLELSTHAHIFSYDSKATFEPTWRTDLCITENLLENITRCICPLSGTFVVLLAKKNYNVSIIIPKQSISKLCLKPRVFPS